MKPKRNIRPEQQTDSVEEKFPKPPGKEEMSEREIHQWYNQKLSDGENEKLTSVMQTLRARHGDNPPDDELTRVMNAFFVDPKQPVDVDSLLDRLETEVEGR